MISGHVSTGRLLARIAWAQLTSVIGRIGVTTIIVTLLLAAGISFNVLTFSVVQNEGAFGLGTVPFLLLAQGVATAMALVLPSTVWDGLPPNRRWALHAQPLPRRTHELVRVAVGGGLALVGVLILYLIAVACSARFSIGGMRWPEPSAWAAAGGSLVLLYGLGSLAGLMTRSTIGTITRCIIWGALGWMTMALFAARYDAVRAVKEWLGAHVVAGKFGLGTAISAGFKALVSPVAPAPIWSALVLWLLATWMAVWFAAGRIPRGGRG